VSFSLAYVLWLYATSSDVLQFPLLHRHRYYRIKQSLGAGAVLQAWLLLLSLNTA
jgi:hypothetical protein